jgi:hypothetical protein
LQKDYHFDARRADGGFNSFEQIGAVRVRSNWTFSLNLTGAESPSAESNLMAYRIWALEFRAGVPDRVAMTISGHKTPLNFRQVQHREGGDLRDAAQ